jgi:hypothetical protein
MKLNNYYNSYFILSPKNNLTIEPNTMAKYMQKINVIMETTTHDVPSTSKRHRKARIINFSPSQRLKNQENRYGKFPTKARRI